MTRQYCPSCERSLSHCLCAHVIPQNAPCATLILRHTDETKHPLGSAALAAKGLLNAAMLTGLVFSERLVYSLLASRLSAHKPILLYTEHQYAPHLTELWSASVLQACSDRNLPFACDSLLLLDGTWRNTREIMLINPWLQALPVLSLEGFVSQYLLRKNKLGGMASIEALAQIYSLMDEDFDKSALLRPFTRMIDQQIEKMGAEVYRAHYVDRPR